jgi:hypothetical protein
MGATDKARQYYTAVVSLTENADPVRPAIVEARAFLARY